MATVDQRLTVEEYVQLPDDGPRTELVRGKIVEISFIPINPTGWSVPMGT